MLQDIIHIGLNIFGFVYSIVFEVQSNGHFPFRE